jgi:amino acid transporter
MDDAGQDTGHVSASAFSPSAEFPPLRPEEVAVLRGIGRRWDRTVPASALPLDPGLAPYCPSPTPGRFCRFARTGMFRPAQPGELTATGSATLPESRVGRLLTAARRVVLGPPLASSAVLVERMRKLVALPVLSSDLLSSVAYGPEAMSAVLALAGAAALGVSLPVAAALVLLMAVVGVSYRQTVAAYPHGAGSYIVASDNLGTRPGLLAAAGLMTDYVLTVSVSVAAGVQATTSALPVLAPVSVPIGLLVIGVLLAGNLRGVRAAGRLFATPTYLFLAVLAVLVVLGLVRAGARGFTALPPPPVPAVEGLGLFLVLRAFASGATSMTGIEAVSNAVPVFRPPEWRNARTTLTWMVGLLVVFFAGLVLLNHLEGLAPRPDETMLSQLARRTFTTGPWYAVFQAATTMILLLAANTAFNDLPRLLFFMSRDGYAPRRFLHMGDRLAFSNGIIALACAAAGIYVAFGGRVAALIPLYAVGVFLAFTLSQAGMVVHWRRRRDRGWRRRAVVNGVGAVLSGLVLLTAAVTKFLAGSWVVVLTVPLLVWLCLRVRRHYDQVGRALTVRPPDRAPTRAREAEEYPGQVRHLVVVPVARFTLAALRALAYAASLGPPVLAVHLSPEEAEARRFRRQWDAWGDHLPLEVVVSPYRAVIAPLANYVEALRAARPDVTLTVVIPELVVPHRWQRLLHSRTEHRLRRALHPLSGVVVTSVPVHLTR